MKKVPMRMCVVCREMKPKKDLIRVVNSTGEIVLDETGKASGRGAYVCKSDCIENLQKRKSFERALGGQTTEELIFKIKELKDDK
jgi:predicted RNA-binding protein YlxR (DUF448 family)